MDYHSQNSNMSDGFIAGLTASLVTGAATYLPNILMSKLEGEKHTETSREMYTVNLIASPFVGFFLILVGASHSYPGPHFLFGITGYFSGISLGYIVSKKLFGVP